MIGKRELKNRVSAFLKILVFPLVLSLAGCGKDKADDDDDADALTTAQAKAAQAVEENLTGPEKELRDFTNKLTARLAALKEIRKIKIANPPVEKLHSCASCSYVQTAAGKCKNCGAANCAEIDFKNVPVGKVREQVGKQIRALDDETRELKTHLFELRNKIKASEQ